MTFRSAPIFLAALIFLSLPVIASSRELLQPRTWKVTPTESPRPQGTLSFKSDVSRKNILGLERPAPFALPTAKRGVPISLASMLEDTVRVLVLKVEFQPEIPDDPNTTGKGTFDMRSYDQFVAEEHHYIDPGPHGTAYFNSHMEGLRRYWYFVSDEKLNLRWDIFPSAESSTFRLPVMMSYYGSKGPWADSSIGDRLGHFLIDAIMFADLAAPEIDFSQYKAIVIFHAGSDQQNNIAFINNTPDDFFTGFIRLAEPIYVDNGANTVTEALQVPETVSQDNRINALNAVLAHEFGHQLGLVDLYDTYNFMTQVGDFSLMDNNGMSVGVEFDSISSSVGGTIPVYPDAWSRAFLGFAVPKVVNRMAGETISTATLNNPESEIVKIPVTDFEYFLVENRQQVNPQTALIADHQTGVILGPGYVDNGSNLVPNGEYDLLAPGNGMLIWHIDEYAAYQDYTGSGQNNFWTNTLQWDKDRRFVSLVEADGVVDFGGNYFRGYGDQNDFFRLGGPTSFTPFSRPPSRTNLGSDSHISITNVSASDSFMTANIDNDWLFPGWPQMSRPAAMSDPLIADIDGNGADEVVMAVGEQILAWRYDGTKLISNIDSVGIIKYDSSIAIYPLAVIAECDANIVGRPVAADLDGDGIAEITAMTRSGNLYAFKGQDTNHDGRADLMPGFPILLTGGNSIQAPIAVNFLGAMNQQLIAFRGGDVQFIYLPSGDSVCRDTLLFHFNDDIMSGIAYSANHENLIDVITNEHLGLLHSLAADSGTINYENAMGMSLDNPIKYLASADIDRDGMPELMVVGGNWVKAMNPPHANPKWAININDQLGKPAVGDINSDGYPEIVLAGDSKIYALSYNGVLLSNFPVNLSRFDLNGAIESAPVLGDVDGDGNPDIIVGLPGGSIYAVNYHGDRVGGFPLPSTFGISRSSALGDINGDRRIDLITVENSGFVNVWGIDTTYVSGNVPWDMAGGDAGNSGYLKPSFEKPVVIADEQLPDNAVYNYPNPARNSTAIRYYLNSDSEVSIDIFDFMGDRVHSAKVAGLAHTANEYVWDCSRVASGIYFCRVEANGGGNDAWRMIKIAVTK